MLAGFTRCEQWGLYGLRRPKPLPKHFKKKCCSRLKYVYSSLDFFSWPNKIFLQWLSHQETKVQRKKKQKACLDTTSTGQSLLSCLLKCIGSISYLGQEAHSRKYTKLNQKKKRGVAPNKRDKKTKSSRFPPQAT